MFLDFHELDINWVGSFVGWAGLSYFNHINIPRRKSYILLLTDYMSLSLHIHLCFLNEFMIWIMEYMDCLWEYENSYKMIFKAKSLKTNTNATNPLIMTSIIYLLVRTDMHITFLNSLPQSWHHIVILFLSNFWYKSYFLPVLAI